MKPDCWGRCEHCFLKKSCRDIESLQEQGRLEAHPVPKCLTNHPEYLLQPTTPAEPLRHRPEIPIREFVDFYISGRYFAKGAACRSCRYDDSCAGAPIEHIRRYGFPNPGMIVD